MPTPVDAVIPVNPLSVPEKGVALKSAISQVVRYTESEQKFLWLSYPPSSVIW